MASENKPCAKCNHIQPLVVCFDCIDKRNTELSCHKILPPSIPMPTDCEPPALAQMPEHMFMPHDIIVLIAKQALTLPLEPHENALGRYARMSSICQRTRAALPPVPPCPQLTPDQRKKLHRIFFDIARSTRDRVECRQVY